MRNVKGICHKSSEMRGRGGWSPCAIPWEPDGNEERGAEEKVIKMFSLCFIELQQMSNKLEKMVCLFVFFFKLPSILFVQGTQMGGWGEGRVANTTHIATFTPDMSLGFSSLEVRNNWKEKKKKCTPESKIGPKTNTQTNKQKPVHGEASSWNLVKNHTEKSQSGTETKNWSGSSLYHLDRKTSFCFNFIEVTIMLKMGEPFLLVSEKRPPAPGVSGAGSAHGQPKRPGGGESRSTCWQFGKPCAWLNRDPGGGG